MTTKKVARTTTQYEVELQRREGKSVAIIEVESTDVYENGRGYAGQSVVNRQVLIVPLSSLENLTDAIVRTLTYNTTADPEERYDLDNDAEKRIGLYSPLDFHTPVTTFYTVAEARLALAPCADGYVIAHLPVEGEFRNIIERKES
jgi:hypothetical protein